MAGRSIGACVAILWLTGVVLAETGGYRILSREGNHSARPDDSVVSIPWENATRVQTGTKSQAFAMLLGQAVSESERGIRIAPDLQATNAQRERLQQQKQIKLREALKPFPGQYVHIGMVVEDVIRLPPPRVDPVRGQEQQFQRSAVQLGPVMIVGRLRSSSTTVYSVKDRSEMAAAKKTYEASLERIEKARRTSKTSAADRKAAESTRNRELEKIRLRAESRKPTHMVYCLTDVEEAMTWKRGQTRSVRGVIQSAGAFIYDRELDKPRIIPLYEEVSYIGIECVVVLSALNAADTPTTRGVISVELEEPAEKAPPVAPEETGR